MKVAVQFVKVRESVFDHYAEDWRGRKICTRLIEGKAYASEPGTEAMLHEAPGGPGEYTFVACQPLRDSEPFGMLQRPRLFRSAREREAYIQSYLATAERYATGHRAA